MLTIQCRRGRSTRTLEATLRYYQPSKIPLDARSGGWAGSAASFLALSGPVGSLELRRALMGLDPVAEAPLVHRSGVDRRYCWDLTFSAPKSISILWAAARSDLRKEIEQTHLEATALTLSIIESTYPLGRRGRNGTKKEFVKVLAAIFPHFLSREGDPQIHAHVLLMNLARYPDNRWGGLDPKMIYRDQTHIGGLYRQTLAKRLERRGFPVRLTDETLRVGGISPEMEEAFSRRHQQIVTKKRSLGRTGGPISMMAALSTRPEKRWHSIEELEAGWRTRLKAFGITPEFVEGVRKRATGAEMASIESEIPESVPDPSFLSGGM